MANQYPPKSMDAKQCLKWHRNKAQAALKRTKQYRKIVLGDDIARRAEKEAAYYNEVADAIEVPLLALRNVFIDIAGCDPDVAVENVLADAARELQERREREADRG